MMKNYQAQLHKIKSITDAPHSMWGSPEISSDAEDIWYALPPLPPKDSESSEVDRGEPGDESEEENAYAFPAILLP